METNREAVRLHAIHGFVPHNDKVSTLLQIIREGLVRGTGNPVPGELCVQSAVCLAFGERHGARPSCVDQIVNDILIELNDGPWTTNLTRAKGMERAAIAQLGTAWNFNKVRFTSHMDYVLHGDVVPKVLRCVAAALDGKHQSMMSELADRCALEASKVTTIEAIHLCEWMLLGDLGSAQIPLESAHRTAHAAMGQGPRQTIRLAGEIFSRVRSVPKPYDNTDPDFFLRSVTRNVTEILVKMGTYGSQFLYLTEQP